MSSFGGHKKTYVDTLDAQKPCDFDLLITSHEFLIDQKRLFSRLSQTFSQYLITRFSIVVRQEVSNLDSSVVEHELELAIIQELYGCLCSLGSK